MSMDQGDDDAYFAGSGDRPEDAALMNIRLRACREEEDASRQGGAGSMNGADGDNASVQRPRQNLEPQASDIAIAGVHQGDRDESQLGAVGGTPHAQRPLQNLQPQTSDNAFVGVHQGDRDESQLGAVGGTSHAQRPLQEPNYPLSSRSQVVNIRAFTCWDKLRNELGDVDESLSGAVGGTPHAQRPLHESNYPLSSRSEVLNIWAFKYLDKLRNELAEDFATNRTRFVNFVVRVGVPGDQSFALLLDVTTPLRELKKTLETYTGIPARFQAWFQDDHELWNMDCLECSNIREDSVIKIADVRR